MNDLELRALYQQFVALRSDVTRQGCIPPDQIVSLAEATLPEQERVKYLTHVATCSYCQRDLSVVRAVVSTGDSRAVLTSFPATRWIAGFAAAAIIVLAVLVWPGTRGGEPEVMRSSETRVELVAPSGSVRSTDTVLVWRAVPRATRYRVEVLTSGGDIVYFRETTDTTVAPPRRAPGEYFWRVTASLDNGSTRSSAAQRFEIRAP